MNFVTPTLAIAGLIAVALPIIIHLLSRRRKRPIEWAAMRFLLEAFHKHRRRLQIEQLILLAVRCLILALLGAALARPILNTPDVLDLGGSRAVFLVIDNGLASGLTDAQGQVALDKTIKQAAKIIESLGPGDSVGLITAARPARGLIVPPSSDHAAVLNVIRKLTPLQAPTDLASAAVTLRLALKDIAKDRERAVVYLLSEFRLGSASLDITLPSALADFGENVTLLTAPAADEMIGNVQVQSIEPRRGLILTTTAEGSQQVTVRLARSGSELSTGTTQVRLAGEGLPIIEPKTVKWDAGQATAAVDFMVNFTGQLERSVALSATIDNDALNGDNQRSTVILTRSKIRTLLVDRRSFALDPGLDRLGTGEWIRRALEPSDQSPIDVVEADPAALDGPDVRGIDAVILARPDLLDDRSWLVLRKFVDGGGVLLVTPPTQVNVHQWTNTFTKVMGLPWRINLEPVAPDDALTLDDEQPPSELLRMLSGELDALTEPILVNRMLALDIDTSQTQQILVLSDGSPLLVMGTPQQQQDIDQDVTPAVVGGMVIYLAAAVDLNWTNLPTKPLMVPLFHELIRQGVGMARASQRFSVGERPALGLGASATNIVGPDGAILAIGLDGRPHEPLGKAGFYEVVDSARHRISTLAVNIDPQSGKSDTQRQSAVSDWLAKSGPWKLFDADKPAAALASIDTPSPIVGILLAAVLLLAVLETALARWFSHAKISSKPIELPGLNVSGALIGGSGGEIR
ncbi:MAG: BatA domain-containing protein [Planctomycetes bacterium]|nr:BatA domain-containing protein [Planctomycetota bacterium]